MAKRKATVKKEASPAIEPSTLPEPLAEDDGTPTEPEAVDDAIVFDIAFAQQRDPDAIIHDACQFTSAQLLELVGQVLSQLPPDDELQFKKRLDKIDWSTATVESKSAEQCQQVVEWLVKEKTRHYRTLPEVMRELDSRIAKASTWCAMPKKPMGAYLRFQNKQREKMLAKNSAVTQKEIIDSAKVKWQTLSATKKARYEASFKADYDTFRADLARWQELDKDFERSKKAIRSHAVQEQFAHTNGTTTDLANTVRLPTKEPQKPFAIYLAKRIGEDANLKAKDVKVEWKGAKRKRRLRYICQSLAQFDVQTARAVALVRLEQIGASHKISESTGEACNNALQFLSTRLDIHKPPPIEKQEWLLWRQRTQLKSHAQSGYKLFCAEHLQSTDDDRVSNDGSEKSGAERFAKNKSSLQLAAQLWGRQKEAVRQRYNDESKKGLIDFHLARWSHAAQLTDADERCGAMMRLRLATPDEALLLHSVDPQAVTDTFHSQCEERLALFASRDKFARERRSAMLGEAVIGIVNRMLQAEGLEPSVTIPVVDGASKPIRKRLSSQSTRSSKRLRRS